MTQSLELTEEQLQLFNKNRKLAYYYAHKYGKLYHIDTEDAIQQCLIGLVYAIRSWDPEKGELSTIAFYRMRRMLSEQERIGRLIKGHPEHVDTVSDNSLYNISTGEDVSASVTSRIEYQHVCVVAKHCLNEWHYKVFCMMYIEDIPQKDIAEMYGLTKQRISQMNIYIRNKLRENLKKELEDVQSN